MQFRNIHAEELEGSTDISGLDDWLQGIGATDASVLILAPPGTGKAAAVGKVAHRLGRDVLLGNLMQLFDYDDPDHQLENLLRLCGAERDRVILLEKLDRAVRRWEERRAEDGDLFASTICKWMKDNRQRLLDDNCTVVFTGRDETSIPPTLLNCFDKTLVSQSAAN